VGREGRRGGVRGNVGEGGREVEKREEEYENGSGEGEGGKE
jgi:hypothetical protein